MQMYADGWDVSACRMENSRAYFWYDGFSFVHLEPFGRMVVFGGFDDWFVILAVGPMEVGV